MVREKFFQEKVPRKPDPIGVTPVGDLSHEIPVHQARDGAVELYPYRPSAFIRALEQAG